MVYNTFNMIFGVKKLDNKYYGSVISAMDEFLKENGFKADKDGTFKSDTKAVKVEYSEERKMFSLYLADISEGIVGEYKEKSAMLFDDTQTDTEYVSIDFVDTLRKNLGIKAARVGGVVDLPNASTGDTMDVSGFAKKVLDIYPPFKELYKAHIAHYGNFLYMEFFGQNFVPQICETVNSGNKKAIKKLLELCENAYITGDRDTVNIMVGCLAAAASKSEQNKAQITQMLAENNHLKLAVLNLAPHMKGKKLSQLLVK